MPAQSPLDLGKFTQLCERLATIDLFGKAPPAPPWGAKSPTAVQAAKAINSGANALPIAYRTGYVQPLLANLAPLLQRSQGQVEPFIAPIYEHAAASKVAPELRRFLAVISNLYRSFLDDAKRAHLNIALNEQLPPLAFFQHDGGQGPYTIPASDLARDVPTNIGVVSLPSVYREHPLLWASLAHETGGHDVVHADAGLIGQLQSGVRALLNGGPITPGGKISPSQLQGLLWAHWMDEAVADVYGLLNIGPQFAFNLAAFFSAMNEVAAKKYRQQTLAPPFLRTDSGPSDSRNVLDEHPTDILRLDLAIGVIGALTGLAEETRQRYIADLRAVSAACAHGAMTITLDGIVPISRSTGVPLQRASLPLAAMQATAQKVGKFIATEKFAALAGHSIQDIETWDELDEGKAGHIATQLLAGGSIVDLGDDAQLLAGANAALLQDPSRYAAVTAALNAALDASYARDPIWGAPAPHGIIALNRLR